MSYIPHFRGVENEAARVAKQQKRKKLIEMASTLIRIRQNVSDSCIFSPNDV